MNKKIIQVDNYDEVELWAGGLLQMKLKYDNGKLIELVCGPMSLEPGIIGALKEEGIYDEKHS